jgi:hypothetical protein
MGVFSTAFGGFESNDLIEGHRVRPLDLMAVRKAHISQVTFEMIGGNLIISITQGGSTLELIPRETLIGDIPNELIEGFNHWFNTTTHEIEFRPQKQSWTHSAENWKMARTSDFRFWQLQSGGTSSKIIDVGSRSSKMISAIFSMLDEPRNLLSTVDLSSRLNVRLSRYELEFSLGNDKQLLCRNFPGMAIDSSQEIGTFIGLHNLLVLRSGACIHIVTRTYAFGAHTLTDPAVQRSRIVLVPKGALKARRDGPHPRVHVEISPTLKRVGFYHYRMDHILHRFEDRTFSESWLFRILLHAHTSHCLEDPFTHRTGVETALQGLCSSAAFSFKDIDRAKELPLLQQLASLTPKRIFYPKHLTVMQAVEWRNDLTWWQQDPEFMVKVKNITSYEKERAFLLERELDTAFLETGSEPLRLRASHSYEKLGRLGLKNPPPPKDCKYLSRHFLTSDCIRGASVLDVSRRSYNKDAKRHLEPDVLSMLDQWGSFPPVASLKISVEFDVGLLQAPLRDRWLTFDASMRACSSRYGPIFFLATLAACTGDQTVKDSALITLLASTVDQGIKSCQSLLPISRSYCWTDGYTVTEQIIGGIVRRHSKDFEYTPELASQKPEEQSYYEHKKACQDLHSHAVEQEVENAIAHYSRFIGEGNPPPPAPLLNYARLEKQLLQDQIVNSFESCQANTRLRHYIQEAEPHLRLLRSQGSSTPVTQTMPSFKSRTGRHVSQQLPSWDSLFESRRPPLLESFLPETSAAFDRHATVPASEEKDSQFNRLLAELPKTTARFRSKFLDAYIYDLSLSADAVRASPHANSRGKLRPRPSIINTSLEKCRSCLAELLDRLGKSMTTHNDYAALAEACGWWPVMDQAFWLRVLHETAASPSPHGRGWFDCTLQLSRVIFEVQRWERIAHLYHAGRYDELERELENTGEQGWEASKRPEWRLFEIENNVTIRAVQADVANRLLSPGVEANCVTQLNMGEGKSSVCCVPNKYRVANTHSALALCRRLLCH